MPQPNSINWTSLITIVSAAILIGTELLAPPGHPAGLLPASSSSAQHRDDPAGRARPACARRHRHILAPGDQGRACHQARLTAPPWRRIPPIHATCAAMAARRPTRNGRAARGSACNSSSTTRRAARTTSCMAIRIRGLPLRHHGRRELAGPAPLEHGVDLRIWRPRRLLAAAGGLFTAAACRSRSMASRRLFSARRSRPRR